MTAAMTPMPTIISRQPFDEEYPYSYMESDKDFVASNLEACVWFLENSDEIKAVRQALINSAAALRHAIATMPADDILFPKVVITEAAARAALGE